MNQGKLEVVKQEMARVNIDILGISELKWTGMGKFNSDDHYIYWASLVAQTVKRLPAVQETLVQSLGWEDPLEKEMATYSSTLAWKTPWIKEPGRLQSMWDMIGGD